MLGVNVRSLKSPPMIGSIPRLVDSWKPISISLFMSLKP